MENDEYLNWLLGYNKPRFEYAKSYYFAQFCEDITSIYQEGDNKVPLFILIEELEKEELYGIESDIIKELVIHLLKLVDETPNQINRENYCHFLGDFLASDPSGIKIFSRADGSFHSLNTEDKLFIFFLLLKKSTRRIHVRKHIAIDSEDNKYFMGNGGRLHVQYGTRLNNLARKERRQMGPRMVEKYGMRPVRLLAETREQWMEVARELAKYGEDDASEIISERIEQAVAMMLTDSQKKRIRREYENSFDETEDQELENSYEVHSIPKSILKQRQVNMRVRFAQEDIDLETVDHEFENSDEERFIPKSILRKRRVNMRVRFAQWVIDKYEKEEKEKEEEEEEKEKEEKEREREKENEEKEEEEKEKERARKLMRCHYFPRCKKRADQCFFAHPSVHCTFFPKCDRGRDCAFLHGPCPRDGMCGEEYCPYEHHQQIPPRASIDYQRRRQAWNHHY